MVAEAISCRQKDVMQKTVALALAAALSLSTSTIAQTAAQKSAPVAVAIPDTVPDAADTPYPGGTMTLDIDASDISRMVYKVKQTIPVAANTSKLTLLFPQWLPGNHGPRGPLAEVVDLRFLVDGKPVKWTRDPVEVYAFHLDLPAGTREVVATFLSPSPMASSEGRITMTQEMLNLQWEKMSLYPAGHYVRQIRVKPTVTLPEGWQVAGALDGKAASGSTVTWAETDYETLVDSPLFAGKYMKRWDLGHSVAMNTFADSPELLEIAPENLATYNAMVDEALLTFGARHFDHYDFLLALTDRMGGIGLEHHRSSENQQEPKSWIDWKGYDWDRNVIVHEFGHSWSGKYRRPAKLWTPDYRQPMQDNLLWVYEGNDQFWGYVLAARSGVQSKDMVLATFANYVGGFSEMPGRGWRSVEDTTHDPVFAARKGKPYATLARGEDYYTEGALTWLEADQIIRKGTAGRKSLDDFAKAFYGMNDGDWGVLTYEFDDVVKTLNSVYPYDWATFLDTRINQPDQPAPVKGIEMGGYKLVWKDEPNVLNKALMADAKNLSLTYSLGFTIDKDGKVVGPQWGSPGVNAGIVTGAKIVAVNGSAYDQDKMKKAITDAKGTTTPIELLVQRGDKFQTVSIDYHDGLRYPWLEKTTPAGAPNGLDKLLEPRRPMAKKKKGK
jgi:predicted metalloprotease with PDZ domain